MSKCRTFINAAIVGCSISILSTSAFSAGIYDRGMSRDLVLNASAKVQKQDQGEGKAVSKSQCNDKNDLGNSSNAQCKQNTSEIKRRVSFGA